MTLAAAAPIPYLGEGFALAAAFTWSCSVILFKRSEAVSPAAMNLFKNVVALALLALTLLALGLREGFGIPERSLGDWALVCLSGVFGMGIADVLVFMALRRLGASLLAIVDCVYAPTMVLFSVVVLKESLGPGFYLGGVLVVGGVLLAVAQRPDPNPDESPEDGRARLGAGVVLGVLGIVFMGAGVVIVKPILEGSSLVEVTTVRLAAGVVAQVAFAGLTRDWATFAVFRPSQRAVWRTLVPGSILGTYVAMLFWLGGFKWALASVASVFNQLSSVFTILLAWAFLKERLTWRRGLGAGVAVAGALIVVLAKPAEVPKVLPLAGAAPVSSRS